MTSTKRLLILGSGAESIPVVHWVRDALRSNGEDADCLDLGKIFQAICHEPKSPFSSEVNEFYGSVQQAHGLFLVATEAALAPSVTIANAMAWLVAAHGERKTRVLDGKIMGMIGVGDAAGDVPMRIFSSIHWQWGSHGAVVIPNPVALTRNQGRAPGAAEDVVKSKMEALVSSFVSLSRRLSS